jgi:hypothetical protein
MQVKYYMYVRHLQFSFLYKMCLHAGILFKLASSESADDKSVGIFEGDNLRNDEFFAKIASHDMKGLLNIYECIKNDDRCGVPLQALIDYKGFRLIAMSILPIAEKATPLMGSRNGGKNVFAEDPTLMNIARKAATNINLAPHNIQNKVLYFGCDVEGHKGEDGVYYFLDFARVLPPENPKASGHLPQGQKTIFYRLLRPEFIKNFPLPLSSDSLSKFADGDPHAFTHNENSFQATSTLVHNLIPRVVEEMVKQGHELFHDLNHKSLSNYLHRRGINMRHLGLLRHHARQISDPGAEHLSNLLLTEIVSRVCKNIIRYRQRKLLSLTQKVTESAFIVLIVDIFNLISGSHAKSDVFWQGICTYIYIYVCIFVYVCIYIFVYMLYLCIYIYMYLYLLYIE